MHGNGRVQVYKNCTSNGLTKGSENTKQLNKIVTYKL